MPVRVGAILGKWKRKNGDGETNKDDGENYFIFPVNVESTLIIIARIDIFITVAAGR